MGILFRHFVIDLDLLPCFCAYSTSLWICLVLSGLLISEVEEEDAEFSATSSLENLVPSCG